MAKRVPFSSNFDPDRRSYEELKVPDRTDYRNELTRILGRLPPENMEKRHPSPSKEDEFYLRLAKKVASHEGINLAAYSIYYWHTGASIPTTDELKWEIFNILQRIEPVD